ncbi:MAG TPA: RNA methyltransferase [Candidatus Wallbacteria bacterium]|nr:RNA methyltransferase [Candidatus Wallbacteria bacterium]
MYFGIGIENSKTYHNLGILWRSAENLGADFIFIVGHRYKKQPSDVYSTFQRIPLFQYADLDDFYAHIPYSCRLVGVENSADATDIREYKHLDRAVYLLGSEDNGMSRKALDMCHEVIKIPCFKGCYNVAVTGSLIMYDRLMKKEK